MAMAPRPRPLQEFLDATCAALSVRIEPGTPEANALQRVAAALDRAVADQPPSRPMTQPACAHLSAAIAGAERGPADVARVKTAFRALVPDLHWRLKSITDPTFAAGHANANLLGPYPEALERRDDVWVGVSLMAPEITYPDHNHPPEEVYLALSRGYWRQNTHPWHEPGIGGVVYNPPGITHAMRSGPEPFLAIWCLPID
jgi:hypothetical protein